MTPPVAVIADPHFHDVHFRQGVGRGDGVGFRTLADTANSTRVFNESFDALPRLLDDIVARGIRIVVIAGDLTDDGQASTMRTAVGLLADYARRFGLRFATPGNHDLYAIHGRHQSKRFLNSDGTHTLVTSNSAAPLGQSVQRIVSADMHCGGYETALGAMRDLGFFRRPDQLHWESPFGADDALVARTFEIASADGRTRRRMIDASYLVEPIEGLWLLSIDANVFEPRDGDLDPAAEASYIDSTDAGWNAMLRHKPFVLDWMAQVAERAGADGKRLLAFSHYPVLDPLGSTLADEVSIFGETSFVRRAPDAHIAHAAALTGIKVHFSGHLHVNDTALWREGRDFLVNVSVPSMVGFPPGYKIAAFEGDSLHVATVALPDVPSHDRAFATYRAEIVREGPKHAALLAATSHGDFLSRHLAEIVRHRYLPREWPADLAEMARTLDLADLHRLSAALLPGPAEPLGLMTLIEDWYRLRKGRDLARDYIPAARIGAYTALAAAFATDYSEDSLQGRVAGILRMLRGYLDALPSLDFRIELSTGEITLERGYRGRTERRQTGAA